MPIEQNENSIYKNSKINSNYYLAVYNDESNEKLNRIRIWNKDVYKKQNTLGGLINYKIRILLERIMEEKLHDIKDF